MTAVSTALGAPATAHADAGIAAALTAQMTYYDDAGAKVFSAGVLNFGTTALWPTVSQILENVWERLSVP